MVPCLLLCTPAEEPQECTREGTKSGSLMAPRARPMDVSVDLQGCSHIRVISLHGVTGTPMISGLCLPQRPQFLWVIIRQDPLVLFIKTKTNQIPLKHGISSCGCKEKLKWISQAEKAKERDYVYMVIVFPITALQEPLVGQRGTCCGMGSVTVQGSAVGLGWRRQE